MAPARPGGSRAAPAGACRGRRASRRAPPRAVPRGSPRRTRRRCRSVPSSRRASACSISPRMCSAFSSSVQSISRSTISLAWSARCWSPAAVFISPGSSSSGMIPSAAASRRSRSATSSARRASRSMRHGRSSSSASRRSASSAETPRNSTTLSRPDAPETTATSRGRQAESRREELDDGVVRPAALGRGCDTHLPGFAVAADDCGALRTGHDADTEADRAGLHGPKDRRASADEPMHTRAAALVVGRALARRLGFGVRGSDASACAGRRVASSGGTSSTTSSADRSNARIRRTSPSRRSLSPIASRSTRRASVFASPMITSPSRRACSRMSCEARSAETSVARRSDSSSTWRAELGLERFDALHQLRPLAPDGLEAVGDLVHQAVDGRPLVAEQAAAEPVEMSDFNRCQGHGNAPFSLHDALDGRLSGAGRRARA